MRRHHAHTEARPQTAWALLACPTRWAEWAPHVRGAWGLGWPQVREGAVGAARLLGVVPVPARVGRVDPGVAWEWRVGLVRMDHRVEPSPDGDGALVVIDLSAPGPLEAAVDAAYGPVIDVLLERLARRAEDVDATGG
jgi:hypothetical protein